MLYGEMREIFRYLNTLPGHYSVTAALCDEANNWTVEIADECGAGYHLASFAVFEQRFPHLMLKTRRPVYWGSDEATLQWWQVLLSLGYIERRYPGMRVRGTLQNAVGCFDLAVVREPGSSGQGRRSGVYLLTSFDDVERVLAA